MNQHQVVSGHGQGGRQPAGQGKCERLASLQCNGTGQDSRDARTGQGLARTGRRRGRIMPVLFRVGDHRYRPVSAETTPHRRARGRTTPGIALTRASASPTGSGAQPPGRNPADHHRRGLRHQAVAGQGQRPVQQQNHGNQTGQGRHRKKTEAATARVFSQDRRQPNTTKGPCRHDFMVRPLPEGYFCEDSGL